MTSKFWRKIIFKLKFYTQLNNQLNIKIKCFLICKVSKDFLLIPSLSFKTKVKFQQRRFYIHEKEYSTQERTEGCFWRKQLLSTGAGRQRAKNKTLISLSKIFNWGNENEIVRITWKQIKDQGNKLLTPEKTKSYTGKKM